MVSGTTQVVAVIGHPIAQVKSPDNFNRYFAEQHMDSVMIPVDIVPDAVAAYLNALCFLLDQLKVCLMPD